jgi:hypothetical protein
MSPSFSVAPNFRSSPSKTPSAEAPAAGHMFGIFSSRSRKKEEEARKEPWLPAAVEEAGGILKWNQRTPRAHLQKSLDAMCTATTPEGIPRCPHAVWCPCSRRARACGLGGVGGEMCRSPSFYQKERFLRLCQHYVVRQPNSSPMSKETLEACLIGLATQARLPHNMLSLGNGRWVKELLSRLVPNFEWTGQKKAKASKLSTTEIAFVLEPVMHGSLPEAAQHLFIREYLHVESTSLTREDLARLRHIGKNTKVHINPAPPGASSRPSSSDLAAASRPDVLLLANGRGTMPIPEEVRRMASLITEVPTGHAHLSERTWHAPQGVAIAAFFVFGGPPEVTMYTWHSRGTKVDDALLEHRPARVRDPKTFMKGHSYLDTFALRPAYFETRAAPTRLLYKRDLFCKGRSLTGSQLTTGPRPNCQRDCGGIGQCALGCAGGVGASGKLHFCAARIRIEITGELMERGLVRISLSGGHHPGGNAKAAGFLPVELGKHHAEVVQLLASQSYQLEFEKQQVIMREYLFKERLILVLSCERRVRNYLLQYLQA